jgi:CheY-like chemotaxis protein
MIKSTDKHINISYDWSYLCVLVVEDNYISFRLLQLSLQKTGVKILHADNGVKAVEMVEQNPDINLVLMDIQLPLMNGYDATRIIKNSQPDLPVIALTANATDEDRLLCIKAGANNYLTKPLNLSQLHQVINDYLIVKKNKMSE